jgi:hypothetical protein
MLRGEETSLGQPGFCARCQRLMPEGPDACLGVLPDVAHACCGHGVTRRAYVLLGGDPGQDATMINHAELLRGEIALRYLGLKIVECEQMLPD